MDRISVLPDDFLLQILSLVPTKDVLTTSLLSKRWRYLWKLVHKLEYTNSDVKHGRFVRFVDKSLLLNTALVLESLHFKICRECSDVNIRFWVRTAVERGLRELSLDYCPYTTQEPIKLPQSLFTCGTLVVLKLAEVSLVDVEFPVCFQFLKTLHLRWVIYLDDETPQKLLSSCKCLQVLVVNRLMGDNVTTYSIQVPSLQKLIYRGRFATHHQGDSGFVMNAPSLKFLDISDHSYECKIEKMSELVAANVEAINWSTDNVLSSLTSLKRLSLCLLSESPYPTGKIFHQLVELEFCTCDTEWDLLMSILKHSPKLRVLKLNERYGGVCGEGKYQWDEPSCIPETLMFGLENLEWRNYRGYKIEKELVAFILEHSRSLKTAIISPLATSLEEKHRMLTELTLLSRGPTTCQLVFG